MAGVRRTVYGPSMPFVMEWDSATGQSVAREMSGSNELFIGAEDAAPPTARPAAAPARAPRRGPRPLPGRRAEARSTTDLGRAEAE